MVSGERCISLGKIGFDPFRGLDHFRFAPAVARPASMKAFMSWIAACFEHLIEQAVLRKFVFAHPKKGAPMTKAAVTEMIIANLDYFGRSHGFPRPNGFSAPL
jgi:hypothetical protein